uniref:tRNA pseudouridine(55) synthase n=1 Tax=Oryza punctata TaxID=4537 RepID=A0A0E0KTW0_ORYPU
MAATSAAAEVDAEARSILEHAAASSFPPLHAVHHLLSVGVCVRCIFRFFGAFSYAAPCLSLTASVLHSFLEEHDDSAKCGSCSCLSKDEAYCSICFGVLLPTCYQDDGVEPLRSVSPIDNVTSIISQAVQREGHQVDEFSLEISLPAVIAANDRAIRLYMKEKYGSANWFNEKIFSQQTMSVKESLRVLLVPSLEKQMNVKHGNNSFRIRLTYTHDEGSQKLLKLLPNDRGRKRKAESRDGNSTKRGSTDDDKHILSESDAFINKTLEGIQDQEFCSLFQLPPEKVLEACHLVISCQRSPIYIGGRYLKLSRNVSQSCWIIDDERMGEASVEEIIGENVRAICKGDGYKFHAAGREDIDVRMLGSGRPFLVEILNVRSIPSATEVKQIADKINDSEKKHVRVRNLKLVGSEIWTMMREGEAEKQKQYAALIWTSRPLTDDDLHNISLIKDMAGTYIKEFVHGDLGRTHPSVGVMLSCRAEILQLDVTDVKMDFLQ